MGDLKNLKDTFILMILSIRKSSQFVILRLKRKTYNNLDFFVNYPTNQSLNEKQLIHVGLLI